MNRRELVAAVAAATGQDSKAVTDIERYFDLFPDRKLASDLFTVVEDGRIDSAIRREYGGMRRPLIRMQQAALQVALANLSAGLPGLFADQEYGALASAPALALAVVGLWRLWRADAGGRRLALTCALPLVALALTTGAFALWSGGSAPPGRELVVAIPLLAVPLAWLWRDSHDRAVARASIE